MRDSSRQRRTKRDRRPALAAVLPAILGLAATGCDGMVVDGEVVAAPTHRLVISGGDVLMDIGEEVQLTAQVVDDSSAGVVEVFVWRWTSSNPAVIAVSAAGVVTALAAGEANVEVTAERLAGGAPLTADVPVTVVDELPDPPVPPPALPVPGRIEAESYVAGGEGVGYHDTTTGNEAVLAGIAGCTADDVDTKQLPQGGCVVGWFAAGEWLAYDVDIATAGDYDVSVDIARGTAGDGSFHLEVDGADASGAIAAPSTGAWETWVTVNHTVTLPAGRHVLRLVNDVDWLDVDGLSFAPAAPVVIAGVPIAPGESIQAIVDQHPAGTTFVLRAGVHRHQTIAPRTGDTFVGERLGGTLRTVLSGARELNGWTTEGGRWWVGGQTQEIAPEVTAAEVCWETHPRCIHPEDLFFDDVLKFHESSLAAVGPGEYFFDYAADRIWVGDDPTGRRVETSVTPYLLVSTAASDVTLRDLIVEKYATPSANGAVGLGNAPVGAVRWTLEDSEVRFNHGGGIGQVTDTTARRNYVHHNCGFGFVGAGADVVVEDNEVAFNNVMAGSSSATCGYNSFWGAGGSKWVYTTRLVVRGNFSHHNDGPGLWTDINNAESLFEDNLVEDNVRGGIFHEISYSAVIRNNVLNRNGTGRHFPYWTTGAGIEVTTSSDVEVYGNTLVDNWQGIAAIDDHRGTGNQGIWELRNLHVHDNIIRVTASMGDGGGRTGLLDYNATGAYSANNRFIDNHYELPAGGLYFFWAGGERTDDEWRAYGHDVGGEIVRR